MRAAAGADGGPSEHPPRRSKRLLSDGEIFDIHHLCDCRAAALEAAVVSLASTAGAESDRQAGAGGAGILPYDAEAGSHAPCERNGHNSHYLYQGAVRAAARSEGDDECVAAIDDGDGECLFVGPRFPSRPLVASAAELRESNAQLNEVKPAGGQVGRRRGGLGRAGACCCCGGSPDFD